MSHFDRSNRFRAICIIIQITALLPPVAALAEGSLDNPANRFMRQNTDAETYASWSGDISLGISGDAPLNIKLAGLSDVLYLSQTAGVTVNASVDFLLDPKPETAKDPLNYLVLFEKGFANPPGDLAKVVEKYISPNQSISPALTDLLVLPPTTFGHGCFGSISSSDSNEIKAFVGLVDSAMNEGEQRACLRGLASLSLGVNPAFNQHELFMGPSKKRILLLDESEIVLELLAQKACRVQAKESNFYCPGKITGIMLKSHADAAER